MTVPLVTVNILTHDRRAELASSLRTMREKLTYPRERLELIVVDNGSSDGTRDMLLRDFPEVRVIENENVGAAGWTRGFDAGRGDYFLVLDDDCFLSGDGLDRAVRAAEDERADLVSFRVISAADPSFEFNSHYRVGLLSFWGCAALISRRAIEKLDGFDPNIFIWANELEFTMRLLDAGFRHLFLPEVTAVHMKPPPRDFPASSHSIHVRHLAYVAAKLLRPADTGLAVANVATRTLLWLLRSPSRWRALPALVDGVRLGLRSRAPVRPAVSRLYRRNFREFASLPAYLRSEAYYARRSDLYPSASGSLSV
jgi:GT2 family glycosyltransferase